MCATILTERLPGRKEQEKRRKQSENKHTCLSDSNFEGQTHYHLDRSELAQSSDTGLVEICKVEDQMLVVLGCKEAGAIP